MDRWPDRIVFGPPLEGAEDAVSVTVLLGRPRMADEFTADLMRSGRRAGVRVHHLVTQEPAALEGHQ